MMFLGFLAAVGTCITSSVVIDSVTAGVGLGISIYSASKGVKQGSRTRRRK